MKMTIVLILLGYTCVLSFCVWFFMKRIVNEINKNVIEPKNHFKMLAEHFDDENL